MASRYYLVSEVQVIAARGEGVRVAASEVWHDGLLVFARDVEVGSGAARAIDLTPSSPSFHIRANNGLQKGR